jgi:membrane protein implicated in regulation of membrane protease activity
MRVRGLDFINNYMSIRRIGRSINRETLQAEFSEEVVGRALRDIDTATGDYINALIDSSRQYWRSVIDRLNQLREIMEQELRGLDAGVYAEQREALEDAIRLAEAELRSYSSGRVIGDMQETFAANMSGFALSAGAAIVGLLVTVLALAAPGPVLGVGALATASLAFVVAAPITALGGYAAWRYYRRVNEDTKRELNTRIDQLEKTYHEALDTLTQKEKSRLTQYGKQVLTPIFSRLEVLSQRYYGQADQFRQYLDQIATLRRGISEMK